MIGLGGIYPDIEQLYVVISLTDNSPAYSSQSRHSELSG